MELSPVAILIVAVVSVVALIVAMIRFHQSNSAFQAASMKYRLAKERTDIAEKALEAADTKLLAAQDALDQANHKHLDAALKFEEARQVFSNAEAIQELSQTKVVEAENARRKADEERNSSLDLGNNLRTQVDQLTQEKEHLETALSELTATHTLQQIDADNLRRSLEDANKQIATMEQALHEAEERFSQAAYERDIANDRASLAEQAQRVAEEQTTQARLQQHDSDERAKNAAKDRDDAISLAQLAEQKQHEVADQATRNEQARHELDERARLLAKQVIHERTARARLMEFVKRIRQERNQIRNKRNKAQEELYEAKRELDKLQEKSSPTPIPKEEPARIIQPVESIPSEKSENQSIKQPQHRSGKRTEEPLPKVSHRESLQPAADIVCVEKERRWVLGVAMPGANENTVVSQDGKPLSVLDPDTDFSKIDHACGTITISIADSIAETIDLGEQGKNSILFKLTGKRGFRQGRRVQILNTGAYLIVVPKTWVPADELLRMNPQIVSDDYYCAYFYIVDKQDQKISFRTPFGKIESLFTQAPKVELVGSRISDASEDMGVLFAEPPRIKALDKGFWSQIKTIVVGEEGRGRINWQSHSILPDSGGEQSLEPVIQGLNGSWFFIRLYDIDAQLLDSLDFRVIRGLANITLSAYTAMPTDAGHEIVMVEFHHAPDYLIKPAGDLESTLELERLETLTRVLIPSDAALDETHWDVVPPNRECATVSILLERIWWAVGEEGHEPIEWLDKIAVLRLNDLSAISSKALWIRTPKLRWSDAVQVGFTNNELRKYPIKVTERSVAVPLRDFCDSPNAKKPGTQSLQLRIQNNGKTFQGTSCKLQSQIVCKCAPCDFSSNSELALYHHVKEQHAAAFFRSLSYQEYWQENRELPTKIAVCSHPGCTFAGESFGVENITDIMGTHAKTFKHFPEQFLIIRDVEKIREVAPHLQLPHKQKCIKCGLTIELPVQLVECDQEKMAHLIQHHRNSLFELQ